MGSNKIVLTVSVTGSFGDHTTPGLSIPPKEIADRIGMSVGWVDQMAVLDNATAAVRSALDSGKIGVEAALMLARKTNQATQEKVLERILVKAKGKRSATAKAAAEVTGTARRPGKKEVVRVIQTLVRSEIEDDMVPVGDVRRLLILALNFAAGEEAGDALVQACVEQLNLRPAPEPEPETEPVVKRGRGRPRTVNVAPDTPAETTEPVSPVVTAAYSAPPAPTPEDFGEL